MEQTFQQKLGAAGLQSQQSAHMGQIKSTTLLRAPASILKNLKNSTISGQMPPKSKLVVPEIIPCRSRIDSTASVSMISSRDDGSDFLCNNHFGMESSCQKSNNTFIKEPPQLNQDPCCRIMEPSCIFIDASDQDFENPESTKTKSSIESAPPRLLLELPARMKSFEEPTKKHIPINDPSIRNCVNCEGRFRLKTMRLSGKLCANCYKIHESVARTVLQFGGTFNLVVKRPGQVELILYCPKGHTWQIGMQSRKAKNGCRQCKDESRVENARRQFEEQARDREEQERQQRVLLDQVVTDIPMTSNHTHAQNIQLELMNEIFVQ
jgi:hypothetical protein